MKKFRTIKFTFIALLAVVFMSGFANYQDKEEDKIQAAITVMDEMDEMKETIPSELLSLSQGIIIVPKMINAGMVIGGKRGKGIALVKDANGKWSDPVFVTITGGSFGAQIGVQAVDLVLVFKNRKSLTSIGKGSFTLGGDLSVAAGPLGRSSSANTDYKLEAEVYSYSRSKGLFAGITLNGASLAIDSKANTAFYNKPVEASAIFAKSNSSSAQVNELKQLLEKY